ncbi:MAG: pyruvate carboxyltransferase [Chloroflexi bacterium GWB2_49_20]|nr:MAG: pyruvate carboxyltransferase [Chloroflexi bacterium GWB2_49_20]OGN78308.1 MAG: pyruvate carboxyltransferase [Chloroflexi bacterium GWC2_49_37]OGN83083.1 MAG: pyruvate carboxyltransferase [Chloroflexi bacterium GWD2_49_16]
MTDQPWHTEKWFVSPWDFLPEVKDQFQFSQKIEIHDVTLRDGEQQAGILFRRDEKVRIAEALAALGVNRIEAGTPAVSKEDEAAVREIVRCKFGPKIFALARCIVEDVKRVADCGVDGAIVEIPCSEHMLQYAYKWPLEKAIDMSIAATRAAHDEGLYVVFFPIDSTRSGIDWYLTLIERVASEGWMDALALVDTAGVLSAHAVPLMVKRAQERIHKPLELHFHNDFGHAVVNTIAGLAAGASVAHLTMNGIGERAGNTPLEETVISLLIQYGVDVGLNYERLYSTAQLVRQIGRFPTADNRPVTGDRLFHVESGIITDWWRNCGEDHILEIFPYRWDLVGQPEPKIVYGKLSGTASVLAFLDQHGIKATEGEVGEMLLLLKEKAIEKKSELNEEDMDAIVEAVLKRTKLVPTVD